MSDEGFDPCECVWGHQLAMRRLVALLRQSQNYCTDSLCFDEPPGPESTSGSDMFLMTFLVIALGFLLVAFRPPSLRDSANNQKRRDAEPDDSAPPPLC